MKLLTIKEISEKWGLSERTIRKLCTEERIPEAELIRGVWMIPEDAYKPERKPPQKQEKQTVPLSPLARQVISQRRRNNHYGIYEHIQVYLTYSSNRMASNRLAKKAVEVLYKKDRIFTTSEDIKVNDIVEARNHFLCVDTILTNAMKPPTQTFINQLQAQLLIDSCKHRRHAPTPVGYRKTPASKKFGKTTPPAKISSAMADLIEKYEAKKSVDLEDILDFHLRSYPIFLKAEKPKTMYHARKNYQSLYNSTFCLSEKYTEI